MESITSENLLNHVKILASDAYEGRGPGGRGEDLTVQYLIQQFQQIGLQPANPNGIWTQEPRNRPAPATSAIASFRTPRS